MRNRLIVIMAVVVLQGLVLLSWSAYHSIARAHGRVIRLETEVFDPWDPLRGDFMVLNYRISTIDVSEAESIPPPGTFIWVRLKESGLYWKVAGYEPSPPDTEGDDVFVRGVVVNSRSPDTLRVEYGIERYFVPEGKGTPGDGVITVDAVVLPSRDLRIKTVYLDGESYP
jgi:uncharacterized membrane-anchored protein